MVWMEVELSNFEPQSTTLVIMLQGDSNQDIF